MSKPPPINPLPTLPSTTSSILSSPTTSRPNTDERSSLPPAPERTRTRQDHPTSPPPSRPSQAVHTPKREESPQEERRMAKRLRRESSTDAPEHSDVRSSPSTDSQSGMADNEMDGGQDKQPEQSEELATSTAPPKKKRTRTLTTPHQSAVLHALLAKSRFPTTAVREEVGRSIGLSARKVQIWFQNQRQKARRPRSQGDAARSRAPQYGPFPTLPEPSSTASTSSAIDSSSITLLPPGSHQSPEGYSSTVETPSRLLGPGMPGIDPYASSVFRARPHTAASSVVSLHHDTQPYAPTHLSSGSRMHTPPPRGFGTPSIRPASSHGPSSLFSRTLPPLNFSAPLQLGYSGSRPVSRHSSFTLPLSSIPPDAHRPPSPDVTFAYRPPDPSPPHTSSLNIPPPFTLQPQPQWDPSVFNAVPRPTSSGWSRPGSRSTRDGSPSPHGLRRDLLPVSSSASSTLPPSSSLLFSTPPEEPRSRAETTPTPPRTGRYDPIRSTLFSHSPTKPSTSSPEQSPRNDLKRPE